MSFSFDHLVFFANNPVEAIPLLKHRGVHAIMGGRHENWGTYNSLTYFGLSYIEFLGIETLSVAEKQVENRLITHIIEQLARKGQEGPARIAIRTNQIDQLALKLKAEGFKVYGPFPGERTRGDGQIIKWSLLFPETTANELQLPFFIQWEKSDEERLLEFKEQGLVGSHPAGNLLFESVGFVVHNLEQTLTKWGRLFDLNQGEEFVDSSINARCRKLELAGTKLLFCEPLGEGIAATVLKEKGEIPFLVNLTVNGQSGIFEWMNGFWRFQSSL
ncbi:VOC family protein [Neobacillus sp. MM2021_6]|uniref:VOC family protein n=1 Tax=Bacillaceae TaxID=186817 RepID=UPI00140B09EA|nr:MULTISPECIES: VOC family protein [Bacillaceae]MBO0959590.1 VOC family protein [Neobacillus sp. MM2021_6]NHC20174.1 VOC family protein [Bacillus sp. MM2020_4]